MCASVIGSAEGLGKTISNRMVKNITSELEDYTMIIIGCDERTFLSLIVDNELGGGPDLIEIQDYIEKLVYLLQ